MDSLAQCQTLAAPGLWRHSPLPTVDISTTLRGGISWGTAAYLLGPLFCPLPLDLFQLTHELCRLVFFIVVAEILVSIHVPLSQLLLYPLTHHRCFPRLILPSPRLDLEPLLGSDAVS